MIRIKKYKEPPRKEIKIKIQKGPKEPWGLEWTNKERKELEKKILNLRSDQLAGLLFAVEIRFKKEDIEYVVEEIKKDKRESIHLDVLIEEADSKENLLWWVDYFTRANKDKK